MLGSKISNTPENNSFASSFIHLKLRGGGREEYMEMELDYRIVDKIMCSLEDC